MSALQFRADLYCHFQCSSQLLVLTNRLETMTTGLVGAILHDLEHLWKHGNTLSMVAKIQINLVIDCGANLTKELSLIGLNRVQPRSGEAKLSLDTTVFAAHGFGAASSNCAHHIRTAKLIH